MTFEKGQDNEAQRDFVTLRSYRLCNSPFCLLCFDLLE